MTRRREIPRQAANVACAWSRLASAGVAIAVLAVLPVLPVLAAPVQAQPAGDAADASVAVESVDAGLTASLAAAGTEDVRDALSREIARMKADIAGIRRLARWQADLARIARTDRAEALRQRRPMADCLASALAPVCDELTGLFRPEEGEEVSPPPPGIGERAP
ncbi:MAG: hypothetical protein F4213_18795 [Boseongicola sp. SB0677_bin_26]|nr:hypothetical protein [Boseongicola sp. SB0665_bin_10]MYG28039.1 hypothetical protein [Boseongicola sp. SB0677_bin_26]